MENTAKNETQQRLTQHQQVMLGHVLALITPYKSREYKSVTYAAMSNDKRHQAVLAIKAQIKNSVLRSAEIFMPGATDQELNDIQEVVSDKLTMSALKPGGLLWMLFKRCQDNVHRHAIYLAFLKKRVRWCLIDAVRVRSKATRDIKNAYSTNAHDSNVDEDSNPMGVSEELGPRELVDTAPLPDAYLEQKEIIKAALAMCDELPAARREIVLMRAFQEEGFETIALALGLKTSTVHYNYEAAKKTIQKKLELCSWLGY